MAAIRQLPSDKPVKQPGIWYTTQKQHWLGWLREYGGPGAYGRKTHDNDARFAYNHVVNPLMLLWLVETCGVPRALARRARKAETDLAGEPYARRAGAIRRCVSWEEVEKALWGS